MKTFVGVITSTAMQNTVVVEVTRRTPHPLYKKLIVRTKRYKADATGYTLAVGNTVKIQETRPLARHKHFKVVEILTEGEKA